MRKVISISNGVTRMPQWRMKRPVSFDLADNEHIAIVGNNGSGKSMLVDIITGRHPLLSEKSIVYDFADNQKQYVSDNIKYIKYNDCYGGDIDRNYYLQQRWNQTEIDETSATVGEKLERAYQRSGKDTPDRRKWRNRIEKMFGLDCMTDKFTVSLSSGELRKLSLAEALSGAPSVVIIDNPFIGLDEETRRMLTALLSEMADTGIVQFILVLSSADDIPSFITNVVEVKDMTVMEKVSIHDFRQRPDKAKEAGLSPEKRLAVLSLPYKADAVECQNVVQMNNLGIRYGNRHILKDINWSVANGERWALTGSNGSGKSTLLSVICADNPQSYACDVTLFDMKRGSGESIWDIKKRIGYVSPEMHRAVRNNHTALSIVATGLNNSFGIDIKLNKSQQEKCMFWMNIFGITHLSNRCFRQMSSGEQRLVLLVRAFVNDPELLILDEPYHGLDASNKALVGDIIDTFCKRSWKTLIFVSHYKNELPSSIDHEFRLAKQS